MSEGMGRAVEKNRAKGVDSARRVLQILLSFSDSTPELTVERIASQFEISVPSAYRYVSLLRELFLIEEQRRGVYTLTSQMFRLAEVAAASQDIATLARPVLDRLVEETRETVLVLRRVADSAMCVASSMPDVPATISFSPGHRMPLHRGAGPKVLLAAMPPAAREKYLRQLAHALSAADREKLLLEATAVERTKYAVSTAEVDEGIFAVAAPIIVRDRTIAALSIAGLDFRLDAASRERLIHLVQDGASEIARTLEGEETP